MSRIRSDTGPFTLIPEWVLDANISDRALRLYGVLGRYADDDGKAHPSRRTLAQRLHCSVDSVDRASKELVEIGALVFEARFTDNGDHTSNEYTLLRAIPVRGSRTAAATGSRTAAAQNENQVERDTEDANASSAVARFSGNAQDVITTVCDAFSAKGIPIPSRHRGMLARQARELLDSDFDFETVVLASVIAEKRGEPQNAHFIAGDLVMARAGERITRREYEKALQDEMEVGRGIA